MVPVFWYWYSVPISGTCVTDIRLVFLQVLSEGYLHTPIQVQLKSELGL